MQIQSGYRDICELGTKSSQHLLQYARNGVVQQERGTVRTKCRKIMGFCLG